MTSCSLCYSLEVHSLRKLVWHLGKFPILEGMDEDAITRLAESSEVVKKKRREVIYLPGDASSNVFFVCDGRVKVSKVNQDGKALTLAYHSPYSLFGESALLGNAPRQEMAETVESAFALKVPADYFRKLISHHAGLGFNMTLMLCGKQRALEHKVENLVFRDVTSKLADLLLSLAKEHGVDDARGTLLALKITHQELANLIGSTRETVSLTLSEFKKKSFICTEGRKVIVSDRQSLQALL